MFKARKVDTYGDLLYVLDKEEILITRRYDITDDRMITLKSEAFALNTFVSVDTLSTYLAQYLKQESILNRICLHWLLKKLKPKTQKLIYHAN